MTTEALLRRAQRAFTPAIALTIVSAFAAFAPARLAAENPTDNPDRNPPFSAITVLGDSLSDTGRTFSVIGIPPPPYFNGRASNGPLWIERLAPSLRLSYQPLDNFSWAGANTNRTNIFPGLPGMLDELDEFLAPLQKRADKKALYIVWGGANDFFRIFTPGTDPNALISEGVVNLRRIVTALHDAGAENIVVIDLPDIGLTPRARLAGASAAATFLSATFNGLLNNALNSLDFPIVRVSSFQLLNAMFFQPTTYGFTNVLDQGIANIANADTYLFWDDVHPTTRAHQHIANAVFKSLADAGLIKQLLKHP